MVDLVAEIEREVAGESAALPAIAATGPDAALLSLEAEFNAMFAVFKPAWAENQRNMDRHTPLLRAALADPSFEYSPER